MVANGCSSAVSRHLSLATILNYNSMRSVNQGGYNIKDQARFSHFQNKAFPGHKKSSVASWNSEGTLLATAENSLRIWGFNHNSGLELLAEQRTVDASINEVKFYHQNLLATVNREMIRLWDIRESIKAIRTEKKSKPDILTLAWNHDAHTPHFALLSKDNVVSIFDLRNISNLANPLHTEKNRSDITEIEWDRSGSVLFCAGGDSGSSNLSMHTPSLQLISEINSPHNSKINSLAVDPTNQYLATCSDDSTVAISSLPDIINERVYSHTDCVMRKVAFSCKAEYLAVSCEEPKIENTSNKGEEVKVDVEEPCIDFYNIRTGGHAHRIKCGSVQQTLEWHPKRLLLAYFDFDEEDKKRAGSEREERYIHIFGV